MKPDVKVFYVTIREDQEDHDMNEVALVDAPAILRNFQAFSAQTTSIKFSIESEEQRKILGPLMIADLPIYRKDEHNGEYYVVFSATTIDKMNQKFHRQKKTDRVNLMHDSSQKVEDVFMIQDWIIDREKGINPPKGYEDAPNGSWFAMFKVENDEVWEAIKSGQFKGFSIEGMFQYGPQKMRSEKEELQLAIEIIEQLIGQK